MKSLEQARVVSIVPIYNRGEERGASIGEGYSRVSSLEFVWWKRPRAGARSINLPFPVIRNHFALCRLEFAMNETYPRRLGGIEMAVIYPSFRAA